MDELNKFKDLARSDRLEKLKALLEEKKAAGQIPQQMAPAPAPAAPIAPQPAISSDEMSELEKEAQILRDQEAAQQPGASNDDRLLQLIRAKLSSRV